MIAIEDKKDVGTLRFAHPTLAEDQLRADEEAGMM
jgi:hypothetical protein